MSLGPVRFDDFILQLDASSRGGFRARVVKSPFGEGSAGFSLPAVAGLELAAGDTGGTSRDLRREETGPARPTLPPQEIGTEIFRAVFQGTVRTLLDKSRGQLEVSPNRGLRLKIKLDPGDAETAALADLPWELLCDGETEDFFALSRQTSVVRYLDVPRSSQPIPFTPPLRILAVSASPSSLPALDLAEEARHLEALHCSASGVEVQLLPKASASAVREALTGDTYNILHFMGHGVFDPATGEGMLAFEGAHGLLELVSGKAFATKLRDLRSLGVVLLNACNTARAGHQEGVGPFRGVATALVLGGVPAVVAMQRPISDRAAIAFSNAFYRHLARGDSVDEALTEGRQAIHSARPEEFEWATPVLFLRIPEGNVFVARPAELPAEKAEAPPAAATASAPAPPEASRPSPGRTASRRGATLKIAAGVAGTGLLAGALYFAIPRPAEVPDLPPKPLSDASGPQPVHPEQPVTTGIGDAALKPRAGTVRKRVTGTDFRVAKTQPDPTTNGQALPPITSPVSPPQATPPPVDRKPDPTPPATADLSSLSAQAVSVTRRDESGLRVTVSFRNSGALPLAVVLDGESAELSDNQGQRYSVLGCDLPASGANPRLDLQAGAAATAHLDFPAPKLGSTKFYLALATADGHRLRVAGTPLTLAAAP